MRFYCCFYSIILFTFFGCAGQDFLPVDPLFQLLSPGETHVSFSNTIRDNDSVNILTYEYLYNGGGVGVLDINRDGLSDLFFTGNQVPNALYLNKGNFDFEDIGAFAGIQLEKEWCTGVSILDINSDGYDDIYVCVGGMGNKNIFPNKLFINQKDLTFRESAGEYGLADPGESIQSAFFDYDKDGDLDLYLLTGGGFEKSAVVARPIYENGEHRNTDRLYRNTYDSILNHPVFEDVSAEAGVLLEGFGLGVAILDANNDSWPDVYVSNDYLSRDQLYINNANGTFTDRSLEFFKHTSHFSMGTDVGDINNDGLPDIVTVDMLPENIRRRKLMFGPNDHDRFYLAVQRDYGHQYMRNMLHLNHGNNGFSEIGQLAGIQRTDWSWAPLLADFDNDGYQDLFITNGFGKDITDLDFVKFRKDAIAPFSDQRKVQKLFLDSLNNRPSILLPNYIYRNEKDLTFSNKTTPWGLTQPSISNGAAYADLDGDGDLEIIVNNINQEAFIYENTCVDRDSTAAGFVRVRLKGPASNPGGLGTTSSLYAETDFQWRYHQVSRGFQSSVENSLHFGLGSREKIDSLVVRWPDGKENILKNIAANKEILVDYEKAVTRTETHQPGFKKKYFIPVEKIDFTHKETGSIDFRTQPLLLRGFCSQGPGLAVGDVNGDGLDDLFIGGAYQSPAFLFKQSPGGEFAKSMLPTENFEDLGAIFFDADGDEDLDLYVASGGAERYAGHAGYQDRLYFNDGKGRFRADTSALPPMPGSTAVICAGDIDQDGDLDLFAGGRVSPREYPRPPASYLLENRSGKFFDITDQVNPALRNIGMVTSAVWTDFNNDSRPDLVVAGEFMRITFLKNQGSKLIDITGETSLPETQGMWNSILQADFDNDGDMDFVAGNLGLNNSFGVTPDQPLEVHYADFDNNGSIDPLFTFYENGVSWPLTSLDQLTRQLPMMKKSMLHYRDFARTNTNDLLRLTANNSWRTLSCRMLASSFIENKGSDRFAISPLPLRAQFAPVHGIAAEDINLDGKPDLILVGNFYETDVVNGRYDASIGTVLVNSGNNIFKPLDPSETSFVVQGDARGLARLELSGNHSLLLVAQNNDKVISYSIDPYHGFDRIKLNDNEMSALLTLSDGKKQKMEFSPGDSYLSQRSRTVVLTPIVTAVELFDSRGNPTRMMSAKEGKASAIALE